MQIAQRFGNDLTLTVQGDLLTSDGAQLAKEAIVRRLLTNPGTYFWHPNYGAGIGRFIGESLSAEKFDEIKNLITSQMFLEDTVSQTPLPIIDLSIGGLNILNCDIFYFNSTTNQQETISFTLS